MPFDAEPETKLDWEALLAPPLKVPAAPKEYTFAPKNCLPKYGFRPIYYEDYSISDRHRFRQLAYEILSRAAIEMETRGWAQHKMIDEKGQVCTYGAIRKVLEVYPRHSELERLVKKSIDSVFGTDASRFNDHFGTKELMVAGLRIAAIRAREDL